MKHSLDLKNVKYSEKVLRKNSHLFDEVDWYVISKHQKLSEWVSEHQKLSEWVSEHQKL